MLPVLRPPLVLTGGPAVGKTVTALSLASARDRCAVIDVDDIRQLVVSGGVAPWHGKEGAGQRRLGVVNASALARNFAAEGVEVVIADVLTPATCSLYRKELPGCFVVHLLISRQEALRRASTRRVWLTDAEFHLLHDADGQHPPLADAALVVNGLTVAAQTAAAESLWASAVPASGG